MSSRSASPGSSGRATQGVRIIKLEDKDRACSIAKVRES
jgi:hypothetical protein